MISVLSPSKLRLVKSGFPWPKMNILPQLRCARQTKLSLLNFHLIPRPNIQKNIKKIGLQIKQRLSDESVWDSIRDNYGQNYFMNWQK